MPDDVPPGGGLGGLVALGVWPRFETHGKN